MEFFKGYFYQCTFLSGSMTVTPLMGAPANTCARDIEVIG